MAILFPAATTIHTVLETSNLKTCRAFGTKCKIRSSSRKSVVGPILKANVVSASFEKYAEDAELRHFTLQETSLVQIPDAHMFLEHYSKSSLLNKFSSQCLKSSFAKDRLCSTTIKVPNSFHSQWLKPSV